MPKSKRSTVGPVYEAAQAFVDRALAAETPPGGLKNVNVVRFWGWQPVWAVFGGWQKTKQGSDGRLGRLWGVNRSYRQPPARRHRRNV